ncbi:hypothetical protein RND81_11G164800 [Saponaria officinalis]|uniref:F-box domain-containing protein n=1 Tax=Saponaria officinalis TaxID=3572 RepID=A0AAW1HN12_SAPOF
MKESRRKVEWGELPEEIVAEIGDRLKYKTERLRFKSVCKSWRSSLSKSHKTKFMAFEVPKPPTLNPWPWVCNYMKGPTYFVTEPTLYAFRDGIGGNWLVQLDEVLPHRFIPNHTFFSLGLGKFFKRKNLVDMSVFPISKYYHIICVPPTQGRDGKDEFFNRFSVVDKTVVVSDDDDDDVSNLVVGALLKRGRVGFLRILRSCHTCNPQEWKVIGCAKKGDESGSIRFDDIVNFDGKLCVVDFKGRAFLVNAKTLELTLIAKEPPLTSNVELERRWRLVEASGEIYLLVPLRDIVNGQVKPEIGVYKLWKQRNEWVEVESIGDQVFFIGCDFSFAASARDVFSKFEDYMNRVLVISESFPMYREIRQNCSREPLFKDVSDNITVGIYDLPHGANFRLISLLRMDGEIVYWIPRFLEDDEYSKSSCLNQ